MFVQELFPKSKFIFKKSLTKVSDMYNYAYCIHNSIENALHNKFVMKMAGMEHAAAGDSLVMASHLSFAVRDRFNNDSSKDKHILVWARPQWADRPALYFPSGCLRSWSLHMKTRMSAWEERGVTCQELKTGNQSPGAR